MHVSLLLAEDISLASPAPSGGGSDSAPELLAAVAGQGRSSAHSLPPLQSDVSRRFPTWLRGGAVPRFRAGVAREAEAFLLHVRRGLPAVLTGGALFPRDSPVGKAWTAAALVRQLDGRSVVAIEAPAPVRRKYVFYRVPEDEKEEGGYDLRAYFRPGSYATKGTTLVRSRGFLARRDTPAAAVVPYLQLPMYSPQGGWGRVENNAPPELARDVMGSLSIPALELLKEHGRLGVLHASTLFLAPLDALSPCHYDEQHNFFCQVGGTKSFLLFAPDAARHLQPFPLHHWADRRARVDLEALRVGDAAGAALRGAAVEALVEGGDTLFLPAYWWHHVHALDAEGVSLSLWYQHDRTLAECARGAAQAAAQATTQATVQATAQATVQATAQAEEEEELWDATRLTLRVRVAREAEAVVARLIGARHVRAFFLRLVWRLGSAKGKQQGGANVARGRRPAYPPLDFDGEGEEIAEEMEARLQAWLLRRLDQMIAGDDDDDEAAVAEFVGQYLGEGRFGGLPYLGDE